MDIAMTLSPSNFYASEQWHGKREDENRVIGFVNSLWGGLLIWAIAIAVVIYYSIWISEQKKGKSAS